MEIRPVERECICHAQGSVRPPGNENHEPACNLRHAATFFSALETTRIDIKERGAHG